MNRLSLLMKMKKAVLFGLFFSVVVATAQTETGSIGGFVKDPSGGVVPKAKVTIKNEGTSAVHTLASDSAGYYIAPDLPPGIYTMSVEAEGFKRFESAHNRLAPNTVVSLDANLTVGATAETVEVTATASVLQTDSAAVQSEVGGDGSPSIWSATAAIIGFASISATVKIVWYWLEIRSTGNLSCPGALRRQRVLYLYRFQRAEPPGVPPENVRVSSQSLFGGFGVWRPKLEGPNIDF